MSDKEKPSETKEKPPLVRFKKEISHQEAALETLKLGGAALAGTLAAKLVGKFGPIAGVPVMYYGVKTGNLPLILSGAGMLSGGSGKSAKPEKGVEDRFENWLEDLKEKFLINDLTSTLPKPDVEGNNSNRSSSTLYQQTVMPTINPPTPNGGMGELEVFKEIELDEKRKQQAVQATISQNKETEAAKKEFNPPFFGVNSNNELY